MRQQWRAAVWVLIGIVNIISVGFLREIANGRARSVLVVTVVIGLALWFGAELLSQYLLTGGQVVVRRLLVAALLVTLGKIGMTAWAEFYMPRMLGLQANMYGPLGVVFVMFTFLAVSMAVLLVATLIAAVWTAPKSTADRARGTGGIPRLLSASGRDFVARLVDGGGDRGVVELFAGDGHPASLQSTFTSDTPGTPPTSVVTALTQCWQLMPETW